MANPKSELAHQAWLDKNPFEGMKIGDNSILNELPGRNPCPKCGKSRKFFCYSCYVPIEPLKGLLPVVKLPLKVDIIKHKHEIDGKSTAGHAAVLAPHDVTIYTYPNIPNYDAENVVLIFPSQNSVSVTQLLQNDYISILRFINNPPEGLPKGINRSTLLKSISSCNNLRGNNFSANKLPINRVIFIDSTWNQSKGIYKDEKLRKIPCVVIQNRISQFWRHQKGSPRWYLATIEALHQFLVEIHVLSWGLDPNYGGISSCFTENCLHQFEVLLKSDKNAYNGQYDNLLYFFQHMYNLIHTYYDHDDLYAYKRRLM